MLCPSGWEMSPGAAVRSKAVPVMPGAAAWAVMANTEATTVAVPRRNSAIKVFVSRIFVSRMLVSRMLISRMAYLLNALLGQRVERRGVAGEDVDFRHHPAEVLGVVG